MTDSLTELEKQLNQKERVRHSTLLRQLKAELELVRQQEGRERGVSRVRRLG
jgi:hypothetical protein